MSDERLASARRTVRDALGAKLEAKATDEFCLAYAYGGADGAPPGAVPLVAELVVPPRQAPAVRGGDPGEPPGPETLDELRDRSLRVIRPVRDFLRRHDPYGETMRGENEPGVPLAVCWLNQSVRSSAPAARFAELADDPTVLRIDVPRRLMRDLTQTIRVVMGPMERRTHAGCTGRNVLVGVIDSEIARDHPALRQRVTPRSLHARESWGRPDDHGTAVAGIIGARSPEGTGLAPEVLIHNYKVLGRIPALDGDDIELGRALQAALEDGVRIVNLSLGTNAPTDGTSREARACNAAWEKGLTIVKSAGNRGSAQGTITCPGDAEGTIVVGATDPEGRGVQRYSSRGPTLNNLDRPDVVAPGGSEDAMLVSCLADGTIGCCGWGTSLAAPHITGLLALMLEKEPKLKPDQLKERLLGQCRRLRGNIHVQGRGIACLAEAVC